MKNQGQLYLHQDHKPLTYSRKGPLKDIAHFSVECSEDRLTSETNVLIPLQVIAVVAAKITTTTRIKDKFANVMANPFLFIVTPSICMIPTVCHMHALDSNVIRYSSECLLKRSVLLIWGKEKNCI